MALQVGAGAVDYGSHGEVEATLIASGGEEGSFTPYGGIRGVRTFLINSDAFPDAPVFGGFAGFRLGTSGFGISAEVGVFRDSHQYATFGRDIVVVPSISFHGDVLGVIARIQDRMRRP